MNYCNCPNCRTDNCPAALETETVAAQETVRATSSVSAAPSPFAVRDEVVATLPLTRWVEELEAAVTILEKLGQPPNSGEDVMLAGAAQHAQQTLERVLQLIRAGSSTVGDQVQRLAIRPEGKGGLPYMLFWQSLDGRLSVLHYDTAAEAMRHVNHLRDLKRSPELYGRLAV